MGLSNDVSLLIGLLAEGRLGEAKAAAILARDRIRETRTELDAELEVVEKIIESSAQGRLGMEALQEQETDGPGEAVSKVEQKHAALATAKGIASGRADGLVTTTAVHTAMKHGGLEPLGRTSIGLVLNASKEWERVDTGLYRLSVREQESDRPVEVISRVEQKHAALATARSLAWDRADRIVSTTAVYEAMKRDGLEPLGRTAIGIVLNHASEWERVDRGLYRLKEPAVEVPFASGPDDLPF